MTADELWDKLVELGPDKPLSVDEFAAKTGLSRSLISKVYERWIQTDKLRKENGQYLFVKHGAISLFETPKSKEFEEVEHKLLKKELKEPEPENTKEPEKPVVVKKKKTDLGGLMRFISAIIGTVLMVTSINFTYSFNKFGMNFFWGMLLSVSIVSFMCFAFTIRSYMSSKFNRIGVVILWTLGLMYSVFTAVSGQYNSFRKYNANDDSTIVVEQKELTEKRIMELEKQYEENKYLKELEREYTLNPDLKTENPQTWALIKKGAAESKEIETELKELKDRQYNLVSNDTVNDTTVYHWLQQTTGIDGNIIQLIMILFPALFMDLCSTICLSFALSKKR